MQQETWEFAVSSVLRCRLFALYGVAVNRIPSCGVAVIFKHLRDTRIFDEKIKLANTWRCCGLSFGCSWNEEPKSHAKRHKRSTTTQTRSFLGQSANAPSVLLFCLFWRRDEKDVCSQVSIKGLRKNGKLKKKKAFL